jgi:two-component system invasion response regulator UvrY
MTPVILLADDHIMLSKGLRKVLEYEFGYRQIHSVTSCNEILKELNKKIYTHLVLDIGLSDGSALEIIPTITRLYPALNIMVFSAKPAAAYQRALRQYGIHNYLSKDEGEEATMETLRKFFYRESGVKTAPDSVSAENPFSLLTARELEILHYVLKGIGSNEIGDALNIKQNTVSTMKSRIFEKTGTANLKELLDLAMIYNVS